jgi:hemerythrin-like domain-containing protein
MSETRTETTAIVETRLVHGMHRRATSVLADTADRNHVPEAAVAELRSFLVATLRHHHEREDHDLWPIVAVNAPHLTDPLADLSREHVRLDSLLDELDAISVDAHGWRRRLSVASAALRDLVHRHLEHEEPVLFPALRNDVPEEAWSQFSRRAVETAPPQWTHLTIGFFDDVGPTEDVDAVLANLPAPAHALLPMLRARAQPILRALHVGS